MRYYYQSFYQKGVLFTSEHWEIESRKRHFNLMYTVITETLKFLFNRTVTSLMSK